MNYAQERGFLNECWELLCPKVTMSPCVPLERSTRQEKTRKKRCFLKTAPPYNMWGLINRLQSIISPTVHRKSELNIFWEYEQIYSNPSDLYLVNRFEKNAHTLKLFYSQKFNSDLLWAVKQIHLYKRTHTPEYEANIHTRNWLKGWRKS